MFVTDIGMATYGIAATAAACEVVDINFSKSKPTAFVIMHVWFNEMLKDGGAPILHQENYDIPVEDLQNGDAYEKAESWIRANVERYAV